MVEWHKIGSADAIRELNSSENGLSTQEASKRREEYGKNAIERKEKLSALKIFLAQFNNFLVWLLIAATLISYFLGHTLDAAAIALILVINALLGFYQEFKSEKAVESIRKMAVQKAIVFRDRKEDLINAEDLVPGDIVVIEEGSKIPADIRLIESANLKIDESSLTGESVPVEKSTEKIGDANVSERKNMGYMGTASVYGRGKGIVVSTGMKTEMGEIASLIEEEEEETPMQARLRKFGQKLGMVVILIALGIFLIGYLRGIEAVELALTSISLAIAAVPEGLPAIVTITFAIGVQAMAKRNAIVRRLAAVETLGLTTVICADKTGTMTSNQMTVTTLYTNGLFSVTGIGFKERGQFFYGNKKIEPLKDRRLKELLMCASLCNNSEIRDGAVIGDPTEGALNVLGKKALIERGDFKRVDEIPFSSSRKMMSVVYDIGKKKIMYSKGAPEVILNRCSTLFSGKSLASKDKDRIMKEVERMAQGGLRVLALAMKDDEITKEESGLRFLGLVGMIDPPTKETMEAIKLCRDAGIKVKMITGDHLLTARAVAREIGLEDTMSVTGEEIDKMDEIEFREVVDSASVFARVSPENKVQILEALKANGHIVAMTGDGVNDAPAIKKADIGIAMGIKGTDVAKETSDMILVDDNFSTIAAAIEEGRGIYDNVKKFIRFLLATNIGEVILVSMAMFAGFPLPLIPIQLLWINLVTDGLPAVSLSVDPKDPDIMKRKPRSKREGLLSSDWKFVVAGGIIASLVAVYLFVSELPDVGRARTMVFTGLIVFELFFVFNCRSERNPVWKTKIFSNLTLLGTVALSLALQLFVVYNPLMQDIFGTVALGLADWGKIILLGLTGFLVVPNIFIKPVD